MRKLLLILNFFFAFLDAYGGTDSLNFRLLTSEVINQFNFGSKALIWIDKKNEIKDVSALTSRVLPQLKPLQSLKYTKTDIIDHDVYMYFSLVNNESTTRNFWVTAGIFNQNNTLFVRDSQFSWHALPKRSPQGTNEQAYAGFHLLPGEKKEFLLRTRFIPSNVSTLSPALVDDGFMPYYINYNHTHTGGLDKITYIICGIFFMMLLFSLATFMRNRKKEFLYYSLYTFFICTLLLFKIFNFKFSTPFNLFQEVYLDLILQLTAFIFYVAFTRKFLNTAENYPVLNHIFRWAEFSLAVFMLIFSLLVFGGSNYPTIYHAENISKYFLIALGLLYIIIGFAQKNKLMNYLVAGNIVNLFFGSISLLFIILPANVLLKEYPLFRSALLYFEIGILIELILFLMGLSYKNRIELIEKVKMQEAMKAEADRLHYEQQIAVMQAQQQERMRISADMHDELGSGVTAIRLLSEIAIGKTQHEPLVEIYKISENANELMSKMNAIIWSMNPGNDTLPAFVAYVRSYVSEFLENLNIVYHFSVPDQIPDVMLPGEKRRNLFLVIKESLNNIVKHSGASKVEIILTAHDVLHIVIHDNGKGISPEKQNQFGNGLKNMKRRMEASGGSFSIYSNNGTTVELTIPY